MVLLVAFSTASFAEERLVSKGSVSLNDTVTAFTVGDWEGDGVSEIFAATGSRIYVIGMDGVVKGQYPVSFTPTVLVAGDIDNVTGDEVLVGSVGFNTTLLNTSRFDFTDLDNKREREAILYKTMRNTGDVYVLSRGGARLFLSMSSWVRDIVLADVNSDRINEILVSSGGMNIDYLEKIDIAPADPKLYEYNIEGVLNCDLDSFPQVTADNVTIPMYENGTVTNCSVKSLARGYLTIIIESVPPESDNQYIRNFTEVRTDNYSIDVFSGNGSLMSEYDEELHNETWSDIALVGYKAGSRIVYGGKNATSIDTNLSKVWVFSSVDKACSVESFAAMDVNNDSADDLFAGFKCPTTMIVHRLDLNAKDLGQFRMQSNNILGMFVLDVDSDGVLEVAVGTDAGLYVLTPDVTREWEYQFSDPVTGVYVGDLGGNPYSDIVVSSGKNVDIYEVDAVFIKEQLAEGHYLSAKDYYDVGKYSESLESLNKAKNAYKELGDEDKLSLVAELEAKVSSQLSGSTKETALSLYKKGRGDYYLGKYNDSLQYLAKALDMFESIGDEENAAMCREAISDVEGEMAPSTTTTVAVSLPDEGTTETTMPREEGGNSPILIAGVLAGLLVIGIVAAKLVVKKKKEPVEIPRPIERGGVRKY